MIDFKMPPIKEVIGKTQDNNVFEVYPEGHIESPKGHTERLFYEDGILYVLCDKALDYITMGGEKFVPKLCKGLKKYGHKYRYSLDEIDVFVRE